MADDLSFDLHTLTARLDRSADRILQAEYDVSYRRFRTLLIVGELGTATQPALAEALGVSEPSVSRMAGVLARESGRAVRRLREVTSSMRASRPFDLADQVGAAGVRGALGGDRAGPGQVDAHIKDVLLGLVDHAVRQGWSLDEACPVLDVDLSAGAPVDRPPCPP